jgi:NADPH2:quinone reductase
MRAIIIKNLGFTLGELPDPAPQGGEVVVRVRAAGLNAADWRQAEGFYPAPPGWPADTPGLEVAGEVESIGDGVTQVEVGDRVMALIGGGGHAERIAIPANLLTKVPDFMSWEQAAAFPETFSTAWDALVTQAGIKAGDRVLVTGAAGGVGTSASQLVGASGAHVVASARSVDTHEALAELLQHHSFDVITPDQEEAFGPYDIILDTVGGEYTLERVPWLRLLGRLIMVGGPGLAPASKSNWLGQMMVNRTRIFGTTIRPRSNEEKSILARNVAAAVLPLIRSGQVTVAIDSVFPLDEYAGAYARLAGRGKVGKVLLAMD